MRIVGRRVMRKWQGSAGWRNVVENGRLILLGWVTSLMIGSLLLGCLGSRPAGSDAPRCGDGIVQAPEVCDDGDALNGTMESYCTLVCGSDELLPLKDERWLRLPFAPKWMQANPTAAAPLVFTSFDDNGVHVVRNYREKSQIVAAGIPVITDKLFVHAAPTSVQLGGDGVVWIEKYTAVTGGPHMYTARLPFDARDTAPIIPRELPYPFPQGEGGQQVDGFLLFDRDRNPPYNMLSAQSRDLFSLDYFLLLNHGPSPGRIQSLVHGDAIWALGSSSGRQLRFFAEPESLVVHSQVPPYGIDAHVFQQSQLAPIAALSGRFARFPHLLREVALLDAGGAVTLHTFFCNEPAREVEDEFTRLEPGTSSMTLMRPQKGDIPVLLTINPRGQLLSIGNNGKGKGLKPLVVFNGPSCVTCTISNFGDLMAAFDDVVAVGGVLANKYFDSPAVSYDYTVDPCLRD